MGAPAYWLIGVGWRQWRWFILDVSQAWGCIMDVGLVTLLLYVCARMIPQEMALNLQLRRSRTSLLGDVLGGGEWINSDQLLSR